VKHVKLDAQNETIKRFVLGLSVDPGGALLELNDRPLVCVMLVPPAGNRPEAAEEPFPAVNSPEWDAMNERRAKLIRKDLDAGLTPAERTEYERLQGLTLAAVQRAFPRPNPDCGELARLREELGGLSVLETTGHRPDTRKRVQEHLTPVMGVSECATRHESLRLRQVDSRFVQ